MLDANRMSASRLHRTIDHLLQISLCGVLTFNNLTTWYFLCTCDALISNDLCWNIHVRYPRISHVNIRAEIERAFFVSRHSRGEDAISCGSKRLLIYNFKILRGEILAMSLFSSWKIRWWQISMQETKSAVPINCLYRNEIPRCVDSCRSCPRVEEEKFTGERVIGAWSVPEVHHTLEQITTLILGYRSISRLSSHVIEKVELWIIYFSRRPYTALNSLYQFCGAQWNDLQRRGRVSLAVIIIMSHVAMKPLVIPRRLKR